MHSVRFIYNHQKVFKISFNKSKDTSITSLSCIVVVVVAAAAAAAAAAVVVFIRFYTSNIAQQQKQIRKTQLNKMVCLFSSLNLRCNSNFRILPLRRYVRTHVK